MLLERREQKSGLQYKALSRAIFLLSGFSSLTPYPSKFEADATGFKVLRDAGVHLKTYFYGSSYHLQKGSIQKKWEV